MNLLDFAVIGIFAIIILLGLYKGFLHSACSTIGLILSCILGFVFMPVMSNSIRANENLYNMMQYYTEGSEFINDSELSKSDISTLSSADLNEIINNSNLPYPIGKEIMENIAKEAFDDENISTLGDYFNLTMVNVFINIVSFLALYLIIRVILAFAINWFDYAYTLPKLKVYDPLFAVAASFIHGMLVLFLVFMLIPVALTLMGSLEFVNELVDGSVYAPLFYKSNFLLSWMPGV